MLRLSKKADYALLAMRHLAANADRGAVSARELVRPTPTTPPEALESEEALWLDVDTATQTLVAYRGTRPLFATLVSTGRDDNIVVTRRSRIALNIVAGCRLARYEIEPP